MTPRATTYASIVAAALMVSTAAAKPRARKARHRRVTVRVVEIAGGQAYLTPGELAGLRPGQTVRFGRRALRINAVARNHASIILGTVRLRVGSRGVARVPTTVIEGQRPDPAPLSTYKGQWAPPTPPSESQRPKRVPLQFDASKRPLRLVVRGDATTQVPLSGPGLPIARIGAGMRLRADPWRERPFGFDADVGVALWIGGDLERAVDTRAQPVVYARELRLRYGPAAAPTVGLGRLRYASQTVGLLDGIRVAMSPAHNLRIAAFGGLVPDVIDGRPDTAMSRFGVELAYADLDSRWRPQLSLTSHGSVFDGALDERRATAMARVDPGRASLMAYAEVSGSDKVNPWGVKRVDLTAAGADGTVRFGPVSAGLRFDTRKPERSRWLASLLPHSWLCSAEELPPTDPATEEPCAGRVDRRHHAAANLALRFRKASIAVGASITEPSRRSEDPELGAYGDARVSGLPGGFRTEFGGMVSNGPFLDTVALRVGAGKSIGLLHSDIDVYYRPAMLRYEASIEDWYEHRIGVDVSLEPSSTTEATVTTEVFAGPDVSGLGLYAVVIWRPQL